LCEWADGSLYWNSEKLYICFQIGVGVCTVLTGDVVTTGEVDKLVDLVKLCATCNNNNMTICVGPFLA